ncbi:MAG: biotin transporter BioY [Planctomycetota bacterium]
MTYSPALTQRWFPARTWYRELAVVGGAVLLIALLARVAIRLPLGVPITGQTFGVLLVGGSLGFRRGVAAIALYIGAGAGGLPVFASGGAGIPVLFGPTAGYLIGFLVAAGATGLMAEHGFLRRYWTAFLGMLAATVPIFAFGLAWLSYYPVPGGAILEAGLLPFIPGAFAKAALAALLLPSLQRFTGRSARRGG